MGVTFGAFSPDEEIDNQDERESAQNGVHRIVGVETAVFGSFLSTCYAWFTILAILGFAKKYADVSTTFAKWASQRSWGLYVFHYLGVSSCALLLYKSGLPPAAIYVITAIAGFGVGYGLYEIISRIPVYRWFVLGIEEKRNNQG